MRASVRIWDRQEKKFFQPTYEAYNGQVDELLLTLNGDLARRSLDGIEHESTFPGRYVVSPDTRLRSKRDERVFEGDILKRVDGRVLHVVWHQFAFCWDVIALNTEGGPVSFSDLRYRDFEIIGNEFENPDMLEQAKN